MLVFLLLFLHGLLCAQPAYAAGRSKGAHRTPLQACRSKIAYGTPLTNRTASRAQTTTDKVDLWSKFYKALSDKFQLGANGQIVSQKFLIDPFLDKSTGGFALSSFVDSVPMWGPMWSESGKKISDGYAEAVDSLYMEVNQQAYDQAQAWLTKYNLAFQIWQQCVGGLTSQWKNFHDNEVQAGIPASDQTAYKDWYASNSQECDPDKTNADSARDKYNFYMDQSAHTGYEFVTRAQENLNATSSFMAVYDGTKTMSVYIADIPGLLNTVSGWYNGQGLNADSFQIDSASSQATEWEWQAEGETAAWDDFIGFEGEGSEKRHSINSKSSQFSMSVSYQALAQFSMTRDPWFNAAILESQQKWIASSPLGTGEHQVGGVKGLVGLIPTGLIVGFQPTISITLEQEDYEFFSDNWQTEGGIEIGPFFIGAEASGSSTTWSKNDVTRTVTFSDKSLTSSLIAVVVDRAYEANQAVTNQVEPLKRDTAITAWLKQYNLHDLIAPFAQHQIQASHLQDLNADLLRELVPKVGRRLELVKAINTHSQLVPAPMVIFQTRVSVTENVYANLWTQSASMDTFWFIQNIGGRTIYSDVNLPIGNLLDGTPVYGHATWVIWTYATSPKLTVNINAGSVHITYIAYGGATCRVWETGPNSCLCTAPAVMNVCNWNNYHQGMASWANSARINARGALEGIGVIVTNY